MASGKYIPLLETRNPDEMSFFFLLKIMIACQLLAENIYIMLAVMQEPGEIGCANTKFDTAADSL